jgi:hypothetical protein
MKGGRGGGGAGRARTAAKSGAKNRSYLERFRKSGKADQAKAKNEQRRRELTEGQRRYGGAARAKNYGRSTAGRGA